MIKHKEALYEIFTAELGAGKALNGKCEVILKTSISKLSDKHRKFLMLGDFLTLPVESGRVKKKFLLVRQDIICGGVENIHEREGEVDAEEWAYSIVKAVRTILRNNQQLVSSSYPSGVARASYIEDAPQEFVLFYDASCCIHTLRLEIHMEEDD